MDAKNLPLNTILKERQQWVVPVYQRQYAWESGDGQQIDTFWSNIPDGASSHLSKAQYEQAASRASGLFLQTA